MSAEGSATATAAAQRPRRRRRLVLLVFAAVATLLTVAVWRAWESRRAPGDGEAPLLRAEPGPARERPEDPGGMDVPYRDVLALHELGVPRDEDGEIVVERLLPPPESPLPRPETGADASETDNADEAPEAPADPATDAPPAAAEENAGATAAAPQETAPAPDREPAPPREEPADAPPVRAPPPAETAAPEDPAPEDEEDPIAGLLARSGEFALQLGAFRTETDIEAGWRRALDRAPDLLRPLERFIVRSDGFHRLRVGPFPDRPGAAQLCEALRRVDVACFVVAL